MYTLDDSHATEKNLDELFEMKTGGKAKKGEFCILLICQNSLKIYWFDQLCLCCSIDVLSLCYFLLVWSCSSSFYLFFWHLCTGKRVSIDPSVVSYEDHFSQNLENLEDSSSFTLQTNSSSTPPLPPTLPHHTQHDTQNNSSVGNSSNIGVNKRGIDPSTTDATANNTGIVTNGNDNSSSETQQPKGGTAKVKKPKRRFLEKIFARMMIKASDRSTKNSSSNSGIDTVNPNSGNKEVNSNINHNNHNNSNSGGNNHTNLNLSHIVNTNNTNTLHEQAHNNTDQHSVYSDSASYTTATTTDLVMSNTTKKSKNKLKIKKIKKSKHPQAEHSIEIDTAMLAMIAPGRQRRTNALLRRAQLFGLCTIMWLTYWKSYFVTWTMEY